MTAEEKKYNALLAVQREQVAHMIANKLYGRMDAAHDRVEYIENYIDQLDRLYRRGQYAPTFAETSFDGWVD